MTFNGATMNTTNNSVDVLIIGAGLSGIGGACQLRRR
jgi:cation diffusion facilitator CzcD-associated flavoprotein CzcO